MTMQPEQTVLSEKRSLATLPRDLLIVILEFSHDIDSLLSTIASCRAFLQAFRVCPSSLLRIVASRHIGTAVLPEAILACKAASLYCTTPTKDTPYQAVYELAQETRESLLQNHKWTISDAFAASRLHSVIKSFASEFAQFYLVHLQKNSKRDIEAPPSEKELARIIRALYWFETYRRLLPALKSDDYRTSKHDDASTVFLSMLSPWEAEQLASIHDSLWRIVAPGTLQPVFIGYINSLTHNPVYNELYFHDVEFHHRRLDYASSPDNDCTAAVLSRGLLHISAVSRANDYASRRMFFPVKSGLPPWVGPFLCESFEAHEDRMWNFETSRSPPPFYADSDAGPETTWFRSHDLDHGTFACANDRLFTPERACGYVFWDLERVQGAGWFDHDWHEHYHGAFIEFEEAIESNEPSIQEMHHSRAIREELEKWGFKGYWEKGGTLDRYMDQINQAKLDEEERLATCCTHGRTIPEWWRGSSDMANCAANNRCPFCWRFCGGYEKVLKQSLVHKCVERLLPDYKARQRQRWSC